jgi:hypothetical protein
MRDLLILAGIGILSAAAWSATADAGASGHGSAHGPAPHGHGGLVGHMRHGGGHAEHRGIPLTTPFLLGEVEASLAAPQILMGGVVVGGPEHMVAGHVEVPAIHPHAHAPLRVERGEAVIPQPTAPGAAESDREGATTAQQNPTVSPWSPRPPGAAGPGRRVSGLSGPGLPGPGRPASPRR